MPARIIPSIERLRQRAAAHALEARYGHDAVVDALRQEAQDLRTRLTGGETPPLGDVGDFEEWAARAIEAGLGERLSKTFRPSLRPVLNATGVIVHTNLGRAPLGQAALERLRELGRGYTNLEYDLERGARGRRDVHAEALLTRLTGAEAAVVVNNNAAATLVLLAALAAGREAIVSRGELVEIGGGFRVPDVMAQSAAALREVGTTNKTRVADYAAAISDRTALILRVHRSNFRVEGFTEQPAIEDLVALGKRFNVPVAEDLGSGNLLDQANAPSLESEPSVASRLAKGVDVVCFSGDKLLGGPQAGVIVGARELVDQVRRHPLMRALRVDKLTYAALEGTLLEYATGRAEQTIPVLRMIEMSIKEIDRRATRLVESLKPLGTVSGTIVDGVSTIGGGSAPGSQVPTRLVALRSNDTPQSLEARLRALDPPVIARIADDQVVLDLRTILPEQDDVLAATMAKL